MGLFFVASLLGGAFALLIVFWLISAYNAFVQLRNQSDNAFAQIEVQLKRRHDLIPNLVETVKGYASHEKTTFEKVIQARNGAVNARTVKDRAEAENVLTNTLKSLFAVAEAYPELKANKSFLDLQEEIAATENRVSFARQLYNDAAMNYDTRIQLFPNNLVAGLFGFGRRDFFQLKEALDRESPTVSFQEKI